MSGFDAGNNTNTQTQTNQSTTNTTAQTPAGGTTNPPRGGILGGSSFFGNLTNNPTITRVTDIMRKWLGEVGESNLEIVPIDGASRGLRMSGIALSYPWQSATKGKALNLTFFILFEETLPERGNTHVMDIGGQQQQVVVTADDWVTLDYLGKLAEVTRLGLKDPNAEICTVGFDIVNRQTSANPNETAVYARIVHLAGEAFAHYIEYMLGEKARDKNTIKEILQGRSLSLNIDTSGIQAFDYQDQPVRNDWTMTMTAKERQATDVPAAGLFDASMIPLTSTSGFVDVTYYEMTDAERLNMQYGQGQFGNAPNQFQRFSATAVITDIQSLRGLWEVDSIVNAFLSTVALTEGNQWAALFQRRFSNSSGARLRDVGYLALEVDRDNGVVDTSSTSYDEYQHMRTMNTLFRPRFDFAIELPRKSVYGFFRQLLRGSLDVGSESYNAFIKALNEYTNGEFPLNFNQVIFQLDNRPVLLGNYPGRGNMGATRHDVRDYEDYLTVLTQVGQTDLSTVKEFDAALAGVDGKTLEARTNTVLNIIERMAGEVTLTGKADRFNINPVFMETLVAATKRAGLSIQTRTVGTMATGVSNRRTENAFGTAFAMGNGQNVFSTGFGTGTGGAGGLGGGITLGFGVN